VLALGDGAAVSATPPTSSSSMEEMARPSSSPTSLPKTPARNFIYKYADGSNVKWTTRYLSSPNTPSAHLTSPSKVPRASAKNPIFEHVEGVKRGVMQNTVHNYSVYIYMLLMSICDIISDVLNKKAPHANQQQCRIIATVQS
jgi:hypothetical protein